MTQIQCAQNAHFNQLWFSGLNRSHMRDLGAKPTAKFHHFSARVFFVQIPKCQDSTIYAILRFFRILFLKNALVPKCPGRARAWPHGPGPWAGPILGPGQAHIWAWPGPYMGLAHIGLMLRTLISFNFR